MHQSEYRERRVRNQPPRPLPIGLILFAILLCGCESEEERSDLLAAKQKSAQLAQEEATEKQLELDKTAALETERKERLLEYMTRVESSAFFAKYDMTREEKVREATLICRKALYSAEG